MGDMACRICRNDQGNGSFIAREMMYGSHEEFEYFCCGGCGCLQIAQYPPDLSKYYPKNYYSYEVSSDKAGNIFVKYLRKSRAKYGITGKGIMGMLIEKVMKKPLMFKLIGKCNVGFSSELLDVGSGAGTFLLELNRIGFRRLTGIDPFIDADLKYDDGVRIVKGSLPDLAGPYDLVFLRDSLEHMCDQHEVLRQIWRVTATGGHVLITMPVVGYAWRTYGANWVGLDAPRHLYIHTVKSVEILFREAGFRVKTIVYDSNEDQFIGSEQYVKGIAMYDKRSYYVDRKNSIFSDGQIDIFREKALELNRTSDGDRICLILVKDV